MKVLTQEQVDWCNAHIWQKWWVNDDGEIEVSNNVDIKPGDFMKFPVQFADISGCFECHKCHLLTSLEGAPREIEGIFDCRHCASLTTLRYASIIKDSLLSVNTDYFYYEGCLIPQEEIDFRLKHPDLFRDWLKSRLSFQEYLQKNKGKIIGLKFGL